MTECDLCDLPTPDPPVADESVDGTYCCRGCLEVARRLDDAGADDPAALDTGADDADGEVAFLRVDGMHCATCEAFLESRATDAAGVRAADASYPAGLVRVVYDPVGTDRDALPAAVSGAGYRASLRADDEEASEDGDVGRLLVGGFFGMMVMVWYVLFLYPAYLGTDALLLDVHGSAGDYLLWNLWLMATVVLGYTGYPVLRGAYVSLRAGRPNMDLLVGLAATASYLFSTATLLAGGTEVYFDVTTVVVLAVAVGNHYEDRVRRRAAARLTDLTEERVADARRRTGDGTETVPVEALSGGDEVVVRDGERVPVDGTVVEGSAAVDESLVTGEALPVRRDPGEDVVGGARVTGGGMVVRVAPDAESTLDRLVSLLWSVQSARPGAQRLADRAAAVFVPVVLLLAAAATAGHAALGASVGEALLVGMSVLVVSCPCALGLATPLAVSAGVRAALRDGVVVTDASLFERASDVETVAVDKTGTLTTGEMRLLARGDDAALRRAAAVEQFADHPLADAVAEAADPGDSTVENFERHPGRGASAVVDGERVVVGTADLLAEEGCAVPADLRERHDAARDRGEVPALVGWDGRARSLLVAGDEPRPGWDEALAAIGEDRRVVVLTGDEGAAAERFRACEAVDEVFAGVPPAAKAEVVERLREDGQVAMVGDGSNDAPALAAADVGVALERGTRLAADAADAVVTTDDLGTVPRVFEVATTARRRVRGNLAWAFCYNAVAVPLAVAGLVNPVLAAVAMAGSSLLVVANSARGLGTTDGGDRSVAQGEVTPS